ncbi:ribonuclease E/G [Haliea sp.]|uniref:ribonuclease E/G n=1 Tax=Haliea sp. TaxID=1932666 RepID=UPI003529893D
MHDEILISEDAFLHRMARLRNGVLQALALERCASPSRVGSIYSGCVARIQPGMDAAFVTIEPGLQGLLSLAHPQCPASLRQGQRLLVQVTRDSVGDKRPQLSAVLGLPGSHLVLLASRQGTGLSRRIQDPASRRRLGSLLAELAAGIEGAGLLARTAAADAPEALLREEARLLAVRWQALHAAPALQGPPRVLVQELPFAQRVLRDLPGPTPCTIRVADAETAAALRSWCAVYRPAFAPLVEYAGGSVPLSIRRGVDTAIESLLQPRVALPSGGSLIIEQTSAMTTVDVNTGAGSGSSDAALTANLEAVAAVPRELRLRGIGGLIAVDFVSLTDSAAWRQVLDALQPALEEDGACGRVHRVDPLGVVLFTRRQAGAPLSELVRGHD